MTRIILIGLVSCLLAYMAAEAIDLCVPDLHPGDTTRYIGEEEVLTAS